MTKLFQSPIKAGDGAFSSALSALMNCVYSFRGFEPKKETNDPFNSYYGVLWFKPIIARDGSIIRMDTMLLATRARVLRVQFVGSMAQDFARYLDNLRSHLGLGFDAVPRGLIVSDVMTTFSAGDPDNTSPYHWRIDDVIPLSNPDVNAVWNLHDRLFTDIDHGPSITTDFNLALLAKCEKALKYFCDRSPNTMPYEPSTIYRASVRVNSSAIHYSCDTWCAHVDVICSALSPLK